jgi:SAM-dependent methyltransferase
MVPANKSIYGIGMSDSEIYARLLSKAYTYENTFYHQEPMFDATSQQLGVRKERYNFVISSDVYEHIPLPVDIAFQNLYGLLAPGGICIFSVPFDDSGSTTEHFPSLHQWKISKEAGKWILTNMLEDGSIQTFDNLCFHGGAGATLEMRRFAKTDLLEKFRSAGFQDIRIHNDEFPEHGIVFQTKNSYVISARRPEK